VVCVVGLGFVGLTLATEFAKRLPVIGFDIDKQKVKKLRDNNTTSNLFFTDDPKEISRADFILIAVPTPVTKSKEPDLSLLESSAKIIAANLSKGSIVTVESTVYPGVTEEIVRPILEESGLKCGRDFRIAYSPERTNPGDEIHTIANITKVVSGMDEETTTLVAELYHKITPSIFIAKDIKTAEAAKIIENIQRDLNIALTNELALIFNKMKLNIEDVLDAAATKWNFHRYRPGLVGGHCIPVDPYYLTYKAKELGYHPRVILAGRAINDFMPKHIAKIAIEALVDTQKPMKNARILIMGLTYKENVADTRENPAWKIIKELKKHKIEVLGYDPLLDNIEAEFEIKAIDNLEETKFDCIILTVAHHLFRDITLDRLREALGNKPILIDIPKLFSREKATDKGIRYETL